MGRKACWYSPDLICTAESYRRLSTDRGSQLLDERKKIHSSHHEFISIYSPHLIKVFLENYRIVFWASPGNEKGEGGCQNQMFSRRNMNSSVMIRHTNLN